MEQSGLVILTPIKSGQQMELRRFLKTHIEPEWNAHKERLICRNLMPFDQLHMLHFACFAVLDEGAGSDSMEPCLLFEATIDGSPGNFLDDLIDLCGPSLDKIYGHCKNYPASGVALPDLAKAYLARHDVQPNISYQGHPGRTIHEVRGEDNLRRGLVDELEQYTQKTADLPASRDRILRHLRRYVSVPRDAMSGCSANLRWTSENRAEPFKTRWGRQIVVLAAMALAAMIAAIGIYASGLDVSGYVACMRDQTGPFTGCASAFDETWAGHVLAFLAGWPFLLGNWPISWAAGPGVFLWTAASALVSWAAARILQYMCETVARPGNAGTGWMLLQALRLATIVLRMMTLVAIFGLGMANLSEVGRTMWIEFSYAGALLSGVLAVLAGIPALLVIRYVRSMPSLDSNFGHATEAKRAWFSLVYDALWLIMAVLIWLLLVAANLVTGFLNSALKPIYETVVAWGVAGALSVLCFLLVLLVVGVIWLLSIRVRELGDNRKYKDANALNDIAVDTRTFAREGHAVNKTQNHLISLSRIKSGRLRLLRLRIVTFIVNQMCHWWFTRGQLGDVRDIHFLRWIIIDGGRRMLFLDTYQGSWSGYLDAFIDSGSVYGLNAIWSHTYQYVAGVAEPVGFPRTESMFWKGARDERPFKAAVRASQKETLVWYSAYPSIGGANIITNSRIRDNLFRSLDTAKIDMLISNIR